MPKVTVQLVTWNGKRYLPWLFGTLREQTFSDFDVIVLDNGSTDGTVDQIKELEPHVKFTMRIIALEKNTGFAGGHNRVFGEHESPYVLLLNQDMLLAPDYIERLVSLMDAHEDAGAASGVLYRWDWERREEGEGGRTKVVDTTGLMVTRSRRVLDYGMGRTDIEIPEGPYEVFGVSGALPMYRRSVLEEVNGAKRIFDPRFFSYKEDVDLAFRLRLAGSHAFVDPKANAWHDRTVRGTQGSLGTAVKERSRKSSFGNSLSYRNHLLCLWKNECWSNFAKDFLWMIPYETAKFFWVLLREWGTVPALIDALKQLPEVMRDRHAIQKNRKVSPSELRKWWNRPWVV
ncbi:MAG: glycosyltransferase family 2 protein [bacterium]|nr:glycosyltransferase family 2 protein [bacterium]